jgi:stage III sporulation protein AF
VAAFFDYLRNITYYLLFSTLAGLAAPSGKYKKYVALITGLVLLLLMIQPLKDIVGRGVPVTEWFSGVITPPEISEANENGPGAAFSAEAYNRWSYGQLDAAFEEQLFAQVESLLSGEGFTLVSADFDYQEDFSRINSMTLTVQSAKQGKPLIYIEPVRIGRQAAPETEPEDPNSIRVKKILSDFYGPDAPHINVILE